MAMERYVLFLSTNTTPDSRFAYRTPVYMGSTFWVPSSRDVSDLPLDTVRDSIKSLVEDVSTYDNGRLRGLRDVVSPYLN